MVPSWQGPKQLAASQCPGWKYPTWLDNCKPAIQHITGQVKTGPSKGGWCGWVSILSGLTRYLSNKLKETLGVRSSHRKNMEKHYSLLPKDRLIRSDQPERRRRVGKGRVVAHCEPRCGQIESNEWVLIPTCLTAVYWKHCPDCTRMQVLHIIIAVSSAQLCILPHLICNAINTYQNNNQ